MAAALRHQLIFHLQCRGPGPLEGPYRTLHVERIAEAGVHIHNQWQWGAFADDPYGLGHFGGAHQAHIRAAEAREGNAGPRHKSSLEAGQLYQPCTEPVIDTRRRQDTASQQQ